MALSWPSEFADIAQPPGLLDEPQDDLITSKPDAGPAKARRRFTASARYVDIPVIFTATQRQAFNTFWSNIWNQAAADAGCFTWTDPLDDSTKTYRFRKRPRWRLATPADTNANVRWEATLELEVLP